MGRREARGDRWGRVGGRVSVGGSAAAKRRSKERGGGAVTRGPRAATTVRAIWGEEGQKGAPPSRPHPEKARRALGQVSRRAGWATPRAAPSLRRSLRATLRVWKRGGGPHPVSLRGHTALARCCAAVRPGRGAAGREAAADGAASAAAPGGPRRAAHGGGPVLDLGGRAWAFPRIFVLVRSCHERERPNSRPFRAPDARGGGCRSAADATAEPPRPAAASRHATALPGKERARALRTAARDGTNSWTGEREQRRPGRGADRRTRGRTLKDDVRRPAGDRRAARCVWARKGHGRPVSGLADGATLSDKVERTTQSVSASLGTWPSLLPAPGPWLATACAVSRPRAGIAGSRPLFFFAAKGRPAGPRKPSNRPPFLP